MKLKTVPKALALCPPFGYPNYSLTLTITNEVYHVTSSNQHKPILFSFPVPFFLRVPNHVL